MLIEYGFAQNSSNVTTLLVLIHLRNKKVVRKNLKVKYEDTAFCSVWFFVSEVVRLNKVRSNGTVNVFC